MRWLYYILLACLLAMLGAALAGYVRVRQHRGSRPIAQSEKKDEKNE